jgi:predicted SprT family Zn-dependent metalloprotease
MKNAKKTKTSNSYFSMMWDLKHYFLYKGKKKLPHGTELNSLVFLMNGLFIKKKPNLKKKKKKTESYTFMKNHSTPRNID